jgi:hypothetical protein
MDLLKNMRFLVLSCLFFIVCWNLALIFQHPYPNELDLAKKFILDCKNQVCVNDWSPGWWIISLGGKSEYRGSPPEPDYNSIKRPYLAYTSQTLFECNLIESQGSYKYYSCN